MIVICGHSRSGSSILLKTLTLSGLESGFSTKGLRSENSDFRVMCYDIAKACGYETLGGVGDDTRYGILYGYSTKSVGRCKRINLDVVKYPAGIFAVDTMLKDGFWKNAKYVFTRRGRSGCVDSLWRFINSRVPPAVVRKLRNIVCKEDLEKVYDSTDVKIAQVSGRCDSMIIDHADIINREFDQLASFLGMDIDTSLINKAVVH